MRLALFHNLPSGGAKRATFEWVRELSKSHEIDLYIFDSESEATWDLRPLVNKIFILNKPNKRTLRTKNKILNLLPVLYKSKGLANKIDAEKYNLVLVMQCKITNSPFLLRFLKTPSFFICHEPMARILEPHYPKKNLFILFDLIRNIGLKFFIRIDKKNAVSATSIGTTSLYSKERLYLCYGLYPKVIYPGVDTIFFKPLKNILCNKSILCVGALFPSKGYEFVIEAVSKIDESERPNLRIIHGAHSYSTEYKIKLNKLAKRNKVKVIFVSLINDNSLLKEYNSALLTICANHLEPLGLVALESMACGTPVVGINEAGLRETIINGDNGILTDRDPVEFSEAIMLLIQNKKICNQMSKFGIKYVSEKWNWKVSTGNLDQHLTMLAKKNIS